MNIDWAKWENLQRRHLALKHELETLRDELTLKRQAEMAQLELVKRAIGVGGLRQRRNMGDLLREYAADPKRIIDQFREEDHGAVPAMVEHQTRLASLRRYEQALADAERRAAAFRPAYFTLKSYIEARA